MFCCSLFATGLIDRKCGVASSLNADIQCCGPAMFGNNPCAWQAKAVAERGAAAAAKGKGKGKGKGGNAQAGKTDKDAKTKPPVDKPQSPGKAAAGAAPAKDAKGQKKADLLVRRPMRKLLLQWP